jgi:hypothetical protein
MNDRHRLRTTLSNVLVRVGIVCAAAAGPCEPDVQPTLAVPYAAVYYFYGPLEVGVRRSDCWVAGDVVGDANPAQVHAKMCGGSPAY